MRNSGENSENRNWKGTMNETEKYLLSKLDEAKTDKLSIKNGKCQHCKTPIRFMLDRKGNGIEVDGEGGADLKYYPAAGKLVGLCGDCIEADARVGCPTEVYSRVVGYIRPVKQWNKGKLAEFKMRETFKTEEI